MALQPETKKARCLSLAGIAQISNDISRKFLDRNDLSRLLKIASNLLKDHTRVLMELDSFFVYDPSAKIKLVFVEDSVLVKNIFVMSSSMQQLAQISPENLYVDRQSNVGPGLNLYSVSCEDESGWKVCASCLSKTNNQDTLRFLIVSVLQSIPKMKAQIKSIIIHPEIDDSLDLTMLLPNTSVRYCMLLILKVLEQKTAHLQSAAQIKTILQSLFHARCLKVYNRHLNDLKAACPADFFQYYFDTWHPSRKVWCTKDSKRLRTDKSIYAYVASLHYTLSSKMGILPSLYQCLRVILRETYELKSVPDSLIDEDTPPVPDSSTSAPVQQASDDKKNELEKMEFYSWDEFWSFLNFWCEEQNIIFVIRNSVPLGNEDMSPSRMQSLKYSMVNLGCSSYTRRRCPATIQLRLGPEMDKLIITKADLNHSHDSEIDLPSRFTRNPEPFVDVPAKVSPDVSDKFIDRTDLTKLLRLHFPFGRESQFLDELESLFNTDPGVKLKLLYIDDKFTVKNIFLMTSAMQTLLHHFPEHIFVAFHQGLNQEFDLYSVLCQDETFSWKVCAQCFARKLSTETLRFLMLSVLQVQPDLDKQIKHLTLSPDTKNPLDIQVLLPNATIKLCLPLVLDVMHCKISFLSQMEQSQIKELLVRLAQASSMDLYTQYLNELKAACPAEIFQYYFGTLHPYWNLWSGKDSRTNDVENSIYNYVKLKHQELRAHLGSLSSLSQCLHAVLVEEQGHGQEPSESSNTCVTDQSASSYDLDTSLEKIDESQDSAGEEIVATGELNKSLSAELILEGGRPVAKDCDDTLKMQLIGKEFQSWDDFCIYLQGWTQEKYLLNLSSSLSEEEVDEVLATSNMAEVLKYSWAQLSCSWKNCSAFIELTLGPQKDKLIVTQSNLHHTHMAEETNDAPPEKKYKPSPAVGLPVQVANNISKKFLEPSDLKRLLRFRSGAFEDRTQVLGELQSLFFSDPAAKVKLVFVEGKLHVKHIFLMTSAMRDVLQNFPEYLFIDVLLEFSQSFALYTTYCKAKGEVEWTPCAYCIARKGVDDAFDFFTGLLAEIVPTLSGKVKLVTVNPDIQQPINLSSHFPHANLRYCMHLVLNLFYCRISLLDTTVEAQIKTFLHILSQTCSLKVYERYLNDLKAICPEDIFQYYYDTWHPRRKMWVKKDNRTEESERNLFQMVSLNHANLKAKVGYMSSLHQCLSAILDGNGKSSAAADVQLQNADIAAECDYEKSILPTSDQQVCELPELKTENEDPIYEITSSENTTYEQVEQMW
ncbi:uncharacterized protein LOC134966143 isoform X3 [Pseudophryne corroboree]|uniref:uncharacterized protein LOC134966143 isoform X3 n=1 Tax=Pseudophryne corroboree TaxID=495146 RepID=UPI003081EB9A